MDEDIGILELRHHLLGVGDEIGREIAAVELHAFDDVELGLGVFASSTVMTPSLPTFFIASEIILPIVLSPLAATVPIWAISSDDCTFLARFSMSLTTAVTAMSMPRLRSIGFMPAATSLRPSFMIEAASTVAVVVPSPARSLVFEATSRTIWAPMFSNLSSSSISLATATPSLVMRGAPYDLSR